MDGHHGVLEAEYIAPEGRVTTTALALTSESENGLGSGISGNNSHLKTPNHT